MRRALLLVSPALFALTACHAAPPSADDLAARGRDVPEPGLVRIGEVQGSGPRSAMEGRQVTVQGVVVGSFAQGLGGVFVQSERDDGDPDTSEGLFVEVSPQAEPALRFGERVSVSGTVAEVGDGNATLTTLRDATWRELGQREVSSLETRLMQAPESAADWERYEGMRLRIAVPLTVTGNNNLSRYGELATSFDGRLFTPTELAAPGPQAAAIAQDNARRRLLLDDNRQSKDPHNLWFLPQALGDAAPLRTGSQLDDVVGVLDQRRGEYRLQLGDKLRVRQAPRPAAPRVDGNLRIASANLLNLFNGDGAGGGFPTERGAESNENYLEQRRKLVANLQALQPDVIGLNEVENDGNGPESSLAQFVAALNAAGPARDWKIVPVPARPGNDSIRVAMIYRSTRLRTVGAAALLRGGPFENRSRVPMTQAFRAGKGPVFTLTAVHLKSKGCGKDEDAARGLDADQHDGQGCWTPVRVDSVQRIARWLASDPVKAGANAPALIVGDFNAYAMEDPMRTIRAADWQDAFALKPSNERPYSFQYDGQAGRLDHALVNAAMAARLRGAVEWHSNADEPDALNYETQRDGDPYRASDHDPLMVGLDIAR